MEVQCCVDTHWLPSGHAWKFTTGSSSRHVPKDLQQLRMLQPLPDDLPALSFGGSLVIVRDTSCKT